MSHCNYAGKLLCSSCFQKGIGWRGNWVKYCIPFRKAIKEYLASVHNVQALKESADDISTPPEVTDPLQSAPDIKPVPQVDPDAALFAKLAKPELQLKLLKLQEANNWTADVKNHQVLKVLKERMQSIDTTDKFFDVISELLLLVECLTILIQLSTVITGLGRLPNCVEGIVHNQQHLKALLQGRVG